MRTLLLGALIGAIGLGAWVYVAPRDKAGTGGQQPGTGAEMVAVTLPELTGEAALGANAFAGLCAACHGPNAGGIDGAGPPLVHRIYEPGHHGDGAFLRAARQGVRSHHWPFGDMPPVEGATDADIRAIIAYVRAVQKENGIF